MNIDRVREERQLLGVDRWFNHQCKGILFWATTASIPSKINIIRKLLWALTILVLKSLEAFAAILLKAGTVTNKTIWV